MAGRLPFSRCESAGLRIHITRDRDMHRHDVGIRFDDRDWAWPQVFPASSEIYLRFTVRVPKAMGLDNHNNHLWWWSGDGVARLLALSQTQHRHSIENDAH